MQEEPLATMLPLDVDRIRARFSALRRDLVFLDGPGGSQMPDEVIDAISGYLRHSNANLGGAFATSRETDAVVDDARMAAADLVGATPDEIVLGANMTTINFQLAHAVARTLTAGDEIVVTELDHDANISPWLTVAADHGLVIRTWPVRTDDCTLQLDDLRPLLSERTRVVAFTLASNAVGTVPDAAAIAALAHEVGALAWADGVHYAPHRLIDVAALGVDVLLCSPYKFFGPHQGIAYGRRELLERWPADRVRPADETPPGHRFETGTGNHEAIAGVTAAIDYLASLGQGGDRRSRLADAFSRIRAHEEDLARRMLAGLAQIEGLRLWGIADPTRIDERTPTFAMTVDGVAPRTLAESLGERGIASWDGNYYALSIMQRLGLEDAGGALRLGLLHYSPAAEVDRSLTALAEAAGGG
jgi:cysteine desulfurase family protein (TIGR01976 family)